MGEHQRALIQLMDRPWSELGEAERELFEAWCDDNRGPHRGANLRLLLDYARARWARPRTSSSQTFEAIKEMETEEKK
jgi:hypothetical protein